MPPPSSPKISPSPTVQVQPPTFFPPQDANPSSSLLPSGVGLGIAAENNNPQQQRVESVKLYSDANSTHFFRRLAWSPDGALLLTPAGLWQDPYYAANAASSTSSHAPPLPSSSTDADYNSSSSEPKPTVYIYSRNNIARPPIAHLPGHQTTSLGIRFCPVFWELRDPPPPTATAAVNSRGGGSRGRGRRRRSQKSEGEGEGESEMDEEDEEDEGGGGGVDVGVDEEEEENAVSVQLSTDGVDVPLSLPRMTSSTVAGSGGDGGDQAGKEGEEKEGKGKEVARVVEGDEVEEQDGDKEPSRSRSKQQQPRARSRNNAPPPPRSLFDLPYRMVYAVATLDSVYLYDTQQAGPLAMFGNLHYAPFTDLTW